MPTAAQLAMQLAMDQTKKDELGQKVPVQMAPSPIDSTEQVPVRTFDPTSEFDKVTTEKLGTAEEQAQRSQLARELMAQQQVAQRQLAAQQARMGVRGGAAAAQQARLSKQLEAERSAQEESGFLARRQFNIAQAQKEQFANLAAELARRQIAAGLQGQKMASEAASKYGAAQLAASQQGGGITVICSELGKQGYLDGKTLSADAEFGRILFLQDPQVMYGYWRLATPIVQVMKKSKVFTYVVSLIAKPWATHMAYLMGKNQKDSFIGKVLMTIGKPICRAFGKKALAYG